MLDKFLTSFDKAINYCMAVFFLLLILIGGYAFFDSYMVYDNVRLNDEIIGLKPKTNDHNKLDSLREVNPDVDGWITIFETTIDYPIVHSKDNLEYLNLDYERKYSIGGSVFIDYRNSRDFEDDYTVTYGHNMTTGQMYSDIKKYEDLGYFSQHLHGVLYTNDDVYKLEIMYLAKVNAYEDNIYDLITYANGRNDELVEKIAKKAKRTNLVNGYDKLLLLSTCDSYGSNDRTVLLAAVKKTDEDEIKTIEESVKANVTTENNEVQGGGGMFKRFLDFWWVVLIVVVALVVLGIVKRCFKKKKSKQD